MRSVVLSLIAAATVGITVTPAFANVPDPSLTPIPFTTSSPSGSPSPSSSWQTVTPVPDPSASSLAPTPSTNPSPSPTGSWQPSQTPSPKPSSSRSPSPRPSASSSWSPSPSSEPFESIEPSESPSELPSTPPWMPDPEVLEALRTAAEADLRYQITLLYIEQFESYSDYDAAAHWYSENWQGKPTSRQRSAISRNKSQPPAIGAERG